MIYPDYTDNSTVVQFGHGTVISSTCYHGDDPDKVVRCLLLSPSKVSHQIGKKLDELIGTSSDKIEGPKIKLVFDNVESLGSFIDRLIYLRTMMTLPKDECEC